MYINNIVIGISKIFNIFFGMINVSYKYPPKNITYICNDNTNAILREARLFNIPHFWSIHIKNSKNCIKTTLNKNNPICLLVLFFEFNKYIDPVPPIKNDINDDSAL